MKRRSAHPSAALVVAVLALVVALGGSAAAVVAAGNGDNLIAKHSLSGNRLKANTVTGKQIKEASLHMPLVWHKLTLLNQWESYNGSVRPPAYAVDAQGIVHFRGAISGGDDTEFAHLPRSLWPATLIYVATDLINAAPGRIDIDSGGVVYADYFDTFDDAVGFTSLDGVTYAP